MPVDDRAIAISATFTAEALQPGLAFWAGELGLDYEIRFAGYNQLFQELLDPAGLFARNRGGINVALVRFADWRQAGIADEARRLVDAIRGAALACAADSRDVPPGRSPRRSGSCGKAWRTCRRCTRSDRRRWRALYPVAEVDDPHARRAGTSAVHARVLRRVGDGDRAEDPRDRQSAVQGDGARLRMKRCGRGSAARTVRAGSGWTVLGGSCRSSWRRGGPRACCSRCAARTTKRT